VKTLANTPRYSKCTELAETFATLQKTFLREFFYSAVSVDVKIWRFPQHMPFSAAAQQMPFGSALQQCFGQLRRRQNQISAAAVKPGQTELQSCARIFFLAHISGTRQYSPRNS
jgi:hypothetical protein